MVYAPYDQASLDRDFPVWIAKKFNGHFRYPPRSGEVYFGGGCSSHYRGAASNLGLLMASLGLRVAWFCQWICSQHKWHINRLVSALNLERRLRCITCLRPSEARIYGRTEGRYVFHCEVSDWSTFLFHMLDFLPRFFSSGWVYALVSLFLVTLRSPSFNYISLLCFVL